MKEGDFTKRIFAVCFLVMFCFSCLCLPAAADELPVVPVIIAGGDSAICLVDATNGNYTVLNDNADSTTLYVGAIGTSSNFYLAYASFVNNYQFHVSWSALNNYISRRTATSAQSYGIYWYSDNTSSYPLLDGFPVYPDSSSFFSAVKYYYDHPPSNDPVAVLVPPTNNYEWATGYSVNNNSSSNIAVGVDFDGSNYILCAASYGSGLVLPGYRNGVSSSYSLSNYDTVNGLYYSAIYFAGSDEPDPGVPVFDTIDDFLVSAASILSDYVPGVNSVTTEFTPGT